MKTRQRRIRSLAERGAALVELAVALPLLVLVLIGTIDFARVFYLSIELTNAARAGAQYGANGSGLNSGDLTAIETAATTAAPNIPGFVPHASRLCECANDSGTTFSTPNLCTTGPCAPCDTTCPSGQHAVTTVTVTAQKTFSTIVSSFPGIPTNVLIQRSATLRVAQ